jgi:hypothetical protein
MGRKLKAGDRNKDLTNLLPHCLGLADELGLAVTAAHIATAMDTHSRESSANLETGPKQDRLPPARHRSPTSI